ncbi:hypothetical protein ACFL6U_08815, partial [Planctomycetota bacterium]
MKRLSTSIFVPLCIALITSCNAGVTYKLSLQGADGTGTYAQGKEVPLILGRTPEGMKFVKWSGGEGYVRDVYSPKTSVLIPARDLNIKATYCDKESCGVPDLDRIRQEVRSSATTESNVRSRHAALRRWWRLFWRQGYDMSAFDETSWILITRREKTPRMMKTIDQGFTILENLFANPVYIAEVEGATDKLDQDGQNEKTRTNWPFYHGIDGAQTGYSPDVGPSKGKLAWRFPKLNQVPP